MTSSPDSGRSFTASLVILDEWAFQAWAQEIWTAAYPTVNRPGGGQVIGLSTGRKGTLFERIWADALSGDNSFAPVFLPWTADPRRDDAWYEETKRNLPTTYRPEYPATPDDAFVIGGGAFFPQWDISVHVINDPSWYPPRYCQIYGAYDAGFGSRACFKWYAVFPEGNAVCYREYYPHQVTDPDQARTIKEMSIDPWGNPEPIRDIVADPSCWNKQSSSGESTAEVFARFGVYMRRADNDLSNGWRRLHQWLMPNNDGEEPALTFTHACFNTIRTYPSCEQKKTNPEDISDQSEHHCQDVDRYFVMSRPVTWGAEAIFPGGPPGSGNSKWSFDDEAGRDEYEDLQEEETERTFYGI